MPDHPFIRRPKRSFLLSALLVLVPLSSALSMAQTAQPKFKVVAIAERGGLHQPFVDAAKLWLAHEAQAGSFTVDYIEDTKRIDDAFLSQYRLFIQLNFPPYAWTPRAVAAFQRYIEEGAEAGSAFITQPCSASLTAIRCGPGFLLSWAAYASSTTFRALPPARSRWKLPGIR